MSLADMIAPIGRVTDHPPRVRQVPMQPGDVDRTYADLTRSRADLGYEPTTSFDDGLRKQWEWTQGLRLEA